MSRNKERFAEFNPETAGQPQSASPTPSGTVPFSFAVPTEFVELPSGGIFYTEGHPLHGISTVEIRFMTAKDEDILTSKAYLSQGVALDRLLESVIVDRRVNPKELLIVDKNAILVAARITGYGSNFETSVLCPACGNRDSVTIDLAESYKISDNAAANGDPVLHVALESADVNIGFRPLTGVDEEWMAESNRMKSKHGLPETPLTDMLRRIIVSVNGIEDPGTIEKLINVLPATESRRIRQAYNDAVPNIEIKIEFNCSKCTHKEALEVPLNADFFWPG